MIFSVHVHTVLGKIPNLHVPGRVNMYVYMIVQGLAYVHMYMYNVPLN